MDLQKQKAEKSARNQISKKIAQQAKAAAKAKAKSEAATSTSSKKRKGGAGSSGAGGTATVGAALPELQEIATLPPEQQVAALQAKLEKEKELDSLISSCSAHLKMPEKLSITKLSLADKLRGASKAKVLEDELLKTKAAVAAGTGKGVPERDQDDECAEFGFKVWKDNASSFAGGVAGFLTGFSLCYFVLDEHALQSVCCSRFFPECPTTQNHHTPITEYDYV